MPVVPLFRSVLAERKDHLSYVFAIVIGVWTVLTGFPLLDLTGRLPPGIPSAQDYLQNLAGQLYFLAQPWHWPLLEATKLDEPRGVNIGLTDSIPLVAIMLKLAHPLLPDVRQAIGPWLGFAWLMQPVAAVYALRGTGERRLVPCVAVALIAAAMPTFLFRMGHAALNGHFLLLIAIGLYLRATGSRASRRCMALLSALVALVLFIHPYLMAMVAAVALAAPATLAIRALRAGAPRAPLIWRWPAQAAAMAIAGIATTLLLARLFGYLQQGYASDYGYYSMNLASPFWPVLSHVAPNTSVARVNATGGQLEGYQYLGAGLLALLLVLVVRPSGRAWLFAACRDHAGLLLVMLTLSAYAVSTHVYLLRWCLLNWDYVPPGGASLRCSGRLFWPVAYVLLIAAIRGTALAGSRTAMTLLLAAAALQMYDAATLRALDRRGQEFSLAPPDALHGRLDAILTRYRAVALQPRLECDANDIPDAMQVIFAASRHDLAVNTMYTARLEPKNRCDPATDITSHAATAPGMIGVAYGNARIVQASIWQRDAAHCAILGQFILCSATGDGLGTLPVPPSISVPTGVTLPPASGDRFAIGLAAGWYPVEPSWGVWATVSNPSLRLPITWTPAPVRVTLVLHASPGVVSEPVRVHAGEADGPLVAQWTATARDQVYSAVLPPSPGRVGDHLVIALSFDTGKVAKVPNDPRLFGIGLVSIRIDLASGGP